MYSKFKDEMKNNKYYSKNLTVWYDDLNAFVRQGSCVVSTNTVFLVNEYVPEDKF
jgi:hypothetical protein